MSWDTKAVHNQAKALAAGTHRGAVDGIRQGLADVLADSNRYVPRDTSALVRSGRVKVDEQNLSGEVVYDEGYASFVHEDMTARHDSGNAKFLENALNRARNQLPAVIADAVDRQTGR